MGEQIMVSFIVLLSKYGDQIDRCLKSILQQTFKNYEIILVANGLTAQTVRSLRQKYPSLTILQNKDNLGSSRGRNQGILAAKGEYIATLDDDVVPDRRWLEELMTWVLKEGGFGMWASKILLRGCCSGIIDSAGIEISKNGQAYNRNHLHRNDASEQPEEVFGPCSAAAIYKKDLFEDIGLFDEDYFIYYEDVDLAFRARLAGWKCLYIPQAIAFHHHSWSLGQGSYRKNFFMERNKLLTIIKNWPLKYMLYYAPRIAAYDLLTDTYYILRKKDFSRLKAKVSAFKQLPRVLRERSKVHDKRRISDTEMDNFWESGYSPWVLYQRRRRLNHLLQMG
jgi:hypothetical protein